MNSDRKFDAKSLHLFRQARKGFERAWRDKKFLRAVNQPCRTVAVPVPGIEELHGSYLISSEKGVFLVRGGRCLRLFEMDAYGMALRGDCLFVAFSNEVMSSVVRVPMKGEPEEGGSLCPEEIFRTPINKSGRIHQLGFYGDLLALALTANNSIELIDPVSGEVRYRLDPFRDTFGVPIRGDHNHINSVSQAGECLLFSAYRAGNYSLLGVAGGNEVAGFQFKNQGVHDIYLSGEDLYFCDTFGVPVSKGGDGCGYLMRNNLPVDESAFAAPPGFATRGVARSAAETLVGHSHKGERTVRFKGKGSIIRLVEDRMERSIELPFSQVYDLMNSDGSHFVDPPAFKNFDEICGRMESIFGPPVLRRTLEAPIPGP